ncbi:glycosyltransferase family 2 protein [Candidatus Daviesbacteria bacterium]|nr:glycosyltransferase family 2 protein [Candidatus Daviesbacteria bacterium]
MKIAIITLNYSGKKDTIEFLESLKRLQAKGYRQQVIVVDNASSDGSVSAIHKAFPEVNIVQTGQNLGFAGGYNKGIDYAQIWGADYFLLVNNDCLIKDTNLVTDLVNTLESDSKIGLVSPKIYFAPGFEFHKDRYKKEEIGKVLWFAGGKFDWDNIGNIHRGIDEVDKGQYDAVEETEIFSGACVMIKKEVLGGLDERYFLYFEDSDFNKRAKNAEFKVYYNGKTSIYHKVSQSTGIGSPITDYYHTRNRLIFGMKYGRDRTKFALLREALKLFIFGRPAQRKGVLDFYLGITGQGNLASHSSSGNVEYPLKLSIGIVNYNTADLTKKLLESIFKQGSGFDPKNMEVIVLDNGQIDPCKEAIKEFLPKIKYLQNQDNEGFSKGYNKTIKYSLGEYYLMLNSDIKVLKDSLTELVKTEDEFKGKAVLGGKLFFEDMSEQDSVFHLPTIFGAFKEYFLLKKGAYFMYAPQGEKPSKVEGLVMACFMIPRKIINKVGLLDEGTFIFFEDIEYCRRLKQFGVLIYFVPASQFIHYHGGSTSKIGQQKAYEHLSKAAEHYHGKAYYILLSIVLRLGQKFGRVQTPRARWMKS